MTRAGSMIVQQWRQFGIDAKVDVGAGHAADAARGRRFRHLHRLERRDLGRPPGPVLLPRQLALAVRRASPASRSRCATGSAGRTRSSTRSSSRSGASRFDDPKGDRARPRVRQARRAGDADHPADGLQRLHGDGSDLLDRLSDRREPLHQSGAELGQLPLHVREAQADEAEAAAAAAWRPPLRREDHARRPVMRGYLAYVREAARAVRCSSSSSASTSPCHHPCDADRSGRAVDRGRRPRSAAPRPEAIEHDAAVAARALRPAAARRSSSIWLLDAHPARPISARRSRPSRRRSRALIGRALPWTVGLLVDLDPARPGCSATCSAGLPATTRTAAA